MKTHTITLNEQELSVLSEALIQLPYRISAPVIKSIGDQLDIRPEGDYQEQTMTKTRDLADLGGGFIQAGTGAVQRTVESKLQDVVSVKDFGAVGDGDTDDTAAFTNAITSVLTSTDKSTLYIPKGVFKVSSLNIQITDSTKTLRIQGSSRGATKLKLTTAAGSYGIGIAGPVGAVYPNPTDGIWGILIENITFDGTSSSLNRAALNLDRCHGAVIRNCFFNKCHSGIRLKDSFFSVVEDVGIWDLTPATGVGIYIDGQQDQYINRVHVDSTSPGGYQYEGLAAIQIVKSGLFNIQSMDVAHTRTGLLINPGSGQLVEWGYVGPAYFDQCSSYGIRINPQSGTIKGLVCAGTWAATCGTGVSIAGTPATNGVTLTDMRIYNCINAGVDLIDTSNISISDCRITGNAAKTTGTCNTNGTTVTLTTGEANTTWPGNTIVINGVTYTIATIVTSTQLTLTASAGVQSGVAYTFSRTGSGVNVGYNVTSLTIADNLIGQFDGHDADQDYGIVLNNGANNIQITGNDFNGNTAISYNITNTNVELLVDNNLNLDPELPTLSAAATLNFGIQPSYILTGTTTITAIGGPRWTNRVVTLYPQSNVTFQVGSTIRATYNATANVPVIAYCDGSGWYFKQ